MIPSVGGFRTIVRTKKGGSVECATEPLRYNEKYRTYASSKAANLPFRNFHALSTSF